MVAARVVRGFPGPGLVVAVAQGFWSSFLINLPFVILIRKTGFDQKVDGFPDGIGFYGVKKLLLIYSGLH